MNDSVIATSDPAPAVDPATMDRLRAAQDRARRRMLAVQPHDSMPCDPEHIGSIVRHWWVMRGTGR